jgi:RHS repeat-associated protein
MMDWRGVPRAVYDELGREIWRGKFGSFGEPLYERGVVSNYIPFRLYGMYKDMETGSYYNVRRYYDWRVGRYLQPDPVSDLNLYAYTNNSPYNAVDPVGMFKTAMRPLGFPHHVGYPHHEKITEDAVNNLGYSKLKWFGPAEDYWSFKDSPWLYSVAQCRGYKNKLAQGANRADYFYEDDSSYHFDNNNFSGCRLVAERLLFPKSRGVLFRGCVDCSGGSQPPSYPSGGGPGKGEGGGGGGCSVSIQRLKEKAMPSECYKAGCRDWQCFFRAPEDYETLGRYLHPVQDFWSHSNSVFVSTCTKKTCASSFLGTCLDWECAEYGVVSYYSKTKIPEYLDDLRTLATGLYGGSKWDYSWSASDDISCQKAISFIGSRYPPCDLQAKVFTHCMLNKDDNAGPDRDCMHACDQGDWPGDCGGDDNGQRYAFWDARNRALTSTIHYLSSFCQEAPNLCY